MLVNRLSKRKKKRKPRTQGLYKCQFLWYKFPPPTIASYQLDSTSAEVGGGEPQSVQATGVPFENLWYRASMEKLRKTNEMFQETNNPVTGEQELF